MKNFFLILFLTLSTFSVSAQTTAIKDTAAVNLDDYTGIYKMASFFKEAVLEVKGGELFAELDSYGSNKLLKEAAKDVFKSTSSYGTIFTFNRNAEGKIIGVKLALMDQEATGEKQ